jgi:adenylosuccinate lyase
MIDRYSLPDMARLWSDQARMDRWLEIEILATEAHVPLGVVPAADAIQVRQRASFTVEAVNEREAVTDHDVAAFVDVVQASVGGEAGKWVHYGLTSTDIVDTALAWSLRDSVDLLIGAADVLIATLIRRAREFANTPCMGRTHGIHAEPMVFGAKLALWAMQLDRDRNRLRSARAAVAVGKLSGAVGTYSNIDPSVEAHVCAALGLAPVSATQVLARDRHAEFLYACASVGATIELIATEVRHLQRTEVREVREPFRSGQKGSSAMPHKRNPITAERLSGLARILRGNLGAGLEDVALWHERDISHSSVERVILPDSALLAHYVLVTCNRMVSGMTIDEQQMLANIEASFGLVFSQSVLLTLVASGLTRDDAYRIVQDNALRAWDERTSFRLLLEAEPRVTDRLDTAALDEAFDLARVLRHAQRPIEALSAIHSA